MREVINEKSLLAMDLGADSAVDCSAASDFCGPSAKGQECLQSANGKGSKNTNLV